MNRTNIPWADRTWNPMTGCTKGCDYCYAAKVADRFFNATHKHATRQGDEAWTACDGAVFPAGFQPTMYPHRLDEPLRLRKPARIFLGSMGDLFDPAFPDSFRDSVMQTVRACQLIALGDEPRWRYDAGQTFLLLTKRPEEMRRYFIRYYQRKAEYADRFKLCPTEAMRTSPAAKAARFEADNPLPNLWLGVTVTNQADADERIPLLLDTPAAHRFVSVEPMLGPVDLTFIDAPLPLNALAGVRALAHGESSTQRVPALDWVVVGGKTPGKPLHEQQDCKPAATSRLDRCPVTEFECGPKCSEYDHRLLWLRSLRDQCAAADVPFFYKHGGKNPELDGVVHDAIGGTT